VDTVLNFRGSIKGRYYLAELVELSAFQRRHTEDVRVIMVSVVAFS
jgi:hypothetical protein